MSEMSCDAGMPLAITSPTASPPIKRLTAGSTYTYASGSDSICSERALTITGSREMSGFGCSSSRVSSPSRRWLMTVFPARQRSMIDDAGTCAVVVSLPITSLMLSTAASWRCFKPAGVFGIRDPGQEFLPIRDLAVQDRCFGKDCTAREVDKNSDNGRCPQIEGNTIQTVPCIAVFDADYFRITVRCGDGDRDVLSAERSSSCCCRVMCGRVPVYPSRRRERWTGETWLSGAGWRR